MADDLEQDFDDSQAPRDLAGLVEGCRMFSWSELRAAVIAERHACAAAARGDLAAHAGCGHGEGYGDGRGDAAAAIEARDLAK